MTFGDRIKPATKKSDSNREDAADATPIVTQEKSAQTSKIPAQTTGKTASPG